MTLDSALRSPRTRQFNFVGRLAILFTETAFKPGTMDFDIPSKGDENKHVVSF